MKQQLQRYNHQDTVLVITSFPNPTNGKYGKRDFNAVGWHSEKTLKQLSKTRRIIVCAEENEGKKSFEIGKNLLISRIWKKGDIFSFLKLFAYISKFNGIKAVFVQFEFNVFGGILPNLALLATLIFLKLSGKKITFELHQVILDIATLKKHINIRNIFLQKFFNISLKFFYIILGKVADNIIVFEEELKNRLKNLVNENKITVLSLSVQKNKVIPNIEAKEKIKIKKDEFVVLVFGYINGYKGIDWIIKALDNIKHDNIRLLITGGPNPYLIDKPFYQKFYASILQLIKKNPGVTHSGFVADNQVYKYFSAADLVVMPYEVFMSASGPFSLALSYEKPIILSEKLVDYSKSKDFISAMEMSNLTNDDLFFPLDKSRLLSLIEKAKTDKDYGQRLANFSHILGDMRSIENVTEHLDNLIFSYRSKASAKRPQFLIQS